jgi:hypothetical protein
VPSALNQAIRREPHARNVGADPLAGWVAWRDVLPVTAVADGVRPVSPLAAWRHLAAEPVGLQAQADAEGLIT